MLSFQNPLHFKVVVEIITTDYTKLDLLLDIPGLVLAAASKSTLRLPFPCKLNNIFPSEGIPLCGFGMWDHESHMLADSPLIGT